MKKVEIVNFSLNSGEFSLLFRENGITTFQEACLFVKNIPFGRTSQKNDFKLVLTENRGTCSSKHALLAILAEENERTEIELIAGIFIMNEITHPVLKDFFKDKSYKIFPEMHCYLRFAKNRFDFTSEIDRMVFIEPKIVREQRIEPHQVGDWKKVLHQDYLQKWLNRNDELQISLEDLWQNREECIQLLS